MNIRNVWDTRQSLFVPCLYKRLLSICSCVNNKQHQHDVVEWTRDTEIQVFDESTQVAVQNIFRLQLKKETCMANTQCVWGLQHFETWAVCFLLHKCSKPQCSGQKPHVQDKAFQCSHLLCVMSVLYVFTSTLCNERPSMYVRVSVWVLVMSVIGSVWYERM